MKRAKAYVGIDIGKRICVAYTMGADGVVLMRSKYPNTRKDVNAFIDGLSAYDCMAACESTARMWIKTYEEFERRGIPITLANPLRLTYVFVARVWPGYLAFCYPPIAVLWFLI